MISSPNGYFGTHFFYHFFVPDSERTSLFMAIGSGRQPAKAQQPKTGKG